MTKKTEQTLSERAVEAQANKTDVAKELGLTPDEVKAIIAFVNIVNKRIATASPELLTASAETHVRKKFPNNDEAVNACDPHLIEDAALEYVINTMIGYPAGNMAKPAPVDDAKSQFHRASVRLVAAPDDKIREVGYAKALKWMTQMKVQQEFKDALNPISQAVYWMYAKKRWQDTTDRTEAAVPVDESLAVLLA